MKKFRGVLIAVKKFRAGLIAVKKFWADLIGEDGKRKAERLFYLCRLHHPADIALLLLPGIAASFIAANGSPSYGALFLLLLAATLFRCAAWIYNDLLEARLLSEASESFVATGIVSRREALQLLAGLTLLSLLLLLPLGVPHLYYAVAAPLLLVAMPFVKIRSLMTQPYLGLCFAWLVPMAWSAQDVTAAKGAWLFFTGVMLWATAFNTVHALSRLNYEAQAGIRSLPQLLGDNSWFFVQAMQMGAVVAFWLAGRELELSLYYGLGLILMLLMQPYQQWLLLSHSSSGAVRNYYTQIASGVALLLGTLLHFAVVA